MYNSRRGNRETPQNFSIKDISLFFIVSIVCICWPSLSTLELKYSAVLEHQYNGRWSIHIQVARHRHAHPPSPCHPVERKCAALFRLYHCLSFDALF